MNKTPVSSLFNLAMAMVIVGSSVVAGKVMIQGLPVFLSSWLRFILAVALLLPILKMREGGLPRLSKRSLGVMAAQSLCGSFLFTVFLLYGLKLTSPGAAGVITSTTPAWIGLIAWVFMRERPGARGLAGMVLSVAGIMAINLADAGAAVGADPLMGNLLVLGAVVFESLFLLLRKAVPEPLSPLAFSTVISVFGLVSFTPLGLYELATTDLGAVSATTWAMVVYYGVVVTVLAYLSWFAGIVRAPAPVAGVMTGVMPLSALILSAAFLDEKLGPAHVAGCVLVMAGIAFISGWKPGRAAVAQRPGAKADSP